MAAPRSSWSTSAVKPLMKRCYTGAFVGAEEAIALLTDGVIEMGRGIWKAGITDAMEEKHKARSQSLALFETPAPDQYKQTNSNKGMSEDMAQQLSDGSSENLEIPDTDGSEEGKRLGPICFCPPPKPSVQQDAERTGDPYSMRLYYLTLREKFGIEPVQIYNRKNIMRAIVRVAVHGIIKHCLRQKQFEDCVGCVIDAPGQRSHDCLYWSEDNVNGQIKDISGRLCMESMLNVIVTLGYVLQCLRLTQEHLALGVVLVDKVMEAKDPYSVLNEIIKPKDERLMRNVERLLGSVNYKKLLRKNTES